MTKLAKKPKPNFKIASGQSRSPKGLDAKHIERQESKPASVNLRYFQRSKECFSKWKPRELKSFSGFIEKMSLKTEADVTSVTKTCHAHKGATAKLLPRTVSPDVKMYSLDVGPKGRVHGFFVEGTFFLVWIDRDGKILGH